MTNKVNIALFVSSANLSNQVLEKLIKLKKKLNIFLVVSDIKFKRKLDKNNIKYFKWVNNSNHNSSNIMKMLEISKDKNLYAFSLQHKWKITKDILASIVDGRMDIRTTSVSSIRECSIEEEIFTS